MKQITTYLAQADVGDEHIQAANKLLIEFNTLTIILVAVGLGVIQFLVSLWVKSRLENAIKHEYAEKLEKYKFDIETRKRAEHVARYLALVSDGKPADNFLALQQLAWELSLWLPDHLYKKLAHVVVENQSAEYWKGLLLDIRKEILGDKAGSLVAENIIHHTRQ